MKSVSEKQVIIGRLAITHGSPFFGYFLWRNKESNGCAYEYVYEKNELDKHILKLANVNLKEVTENQDVRIK